MKFFVMIVGLGKGWQPAVESVKRQIQKDGDVYILAIEDGCGGESDIISPIGGVYNELIWKRHERNYAAKNIYDGINKLQIFAPNKYDVVVHIDADDPGLFGNSVFGRLASIYSNKNIWLTHGSYLRMSDGKTIGSGYPSRESVRSSRWRASHLRTYRYGLIEKLGEDCYKDGENWFRVCADLATMFPMMEMAGSDRVRYISKPMYYYNDTIDTNDYKIMGDEQRRIDNLLRNRKPFERLGRL